MALGIACFVSFTRLASSPVGEAWCIRETQVSIFRFKPHCVLTCEVCTEYSRALSRPGSVNERERVARKSAWVATDGAERRITTAADGSSVYPPHSASAVRQTTIDGAISANFLTQRPSPLPTILAPCPPSPAVLVPPPSQSCRQATKERRRTTTMACST